MSSRTLYLVRHGAVVEQQRFWGWTDVELSEQGRRQAELLAQKAAQWDPQRILGSDLLRVRQTAQPLLKRTGLELETVANLRECRFGEWEGLTWEEILQRDPQLAKRFMADWKAFAPPGGESIQEMAQRVTRAWRSIWEQPWQRLILIAHSGTNRLLLLHFLGMPLKRLFRIGQDYAAWSRVDFQGKTPVVLHLNVPVDEEGIRTRESGIRKRGTRIPEGQGQG